ncbi:MAG: ECF-type sigma factor [Thermoguttaceae bacterium]|nr:ECF-type sigma factor [Thermoguttaceae bacterium]MDW8038248.1 ECF-type sigma factor [Thermoguttaceae bacterium]
MCQTTHHITQLLRRIQQGDNRAQELLFEMVYTELRRVADLKMRGEAADCLLQPTVLVHEAYLKLFGGGEGPAFEDRRHFFGAMSRAMQQVLVDYARKRLAKKRTPPAEAMPQAQTLHQRCQEILQVDAHLERLGAEDPQAAELVRMRFFGGYTMAEVAQALGISERTAHRKWAFAQARLRQWIHHAEGQ